MTTVLRAVVLSLLLTIAITAFNGNESAIAPAGQVTRTASRLDTQVYLDAEPLAEFSASIEQARLENEILSVAVTIDNGDEIVIAEEF